MKTISMTAARQKSEQYKAVVEKMQEENIKLKNRMCEVLSNPVTPSLLGEFENFQNKFIREDEVLKLLRYNILELDNLVQAAVSREGTLNGPVSEKIGIIQSNTQVARRQLQELKTEFNRFLATNDCC